MKRRDILKGVILATGAAVVGLPAVAWDKPQPLRVELFVYIDVLGINLVPRFQGLIESWERDHADFRPMGDVEFEPQTDLGSSWLVHEAWGPDSPMRFYTESRTIFRDRRWDTIERVIYQRENAYWDQLREDGPPIKSRPSRVRVRFEAVRLLGTG